MAVKRKELAEAVLELVTKAKNSQEAAKAVAAYLITERRTKELNSLLRDPEELRFKKDDSLEITATSAYPLSVETKELIKQLFGAKKARIHQDINKEALGGVKVRALDKVADFSVQARLQRLRQGGKA